MIRIRGAFQSYLNMTFGVGAMLGAGLGGMMADYLGWRWEFGIQVPFIVVSLVVAVLTIPHDLGLQGKPQVSVREAMKTFDFKGSFLMSTSVTFFILGMVRIRFLSWIIFADIGCLLRIWAAMFSLVSFQALYTGGF